MIAAIMLLIFFQQIAKNGREENSAISYSQFIEEVQHDRVSDATITGNMITGFKINWKNKDGKYFTTYAQNDPGMWGDLLRYGVTTKVIPPEEPSFLYTMLVTFGPILLMLGVWIFFMRKMQGGGGQGGMFGFGKSRAKLLDKDTQLVTFADVAGCDEAKEDVAELVEFLRDPSRFQKLGGRIPRGVLMVGSPGTGKTLLAKAVAGEAKVPFFSISGSDFVEMFVGVGAARVRDMFAEAKKNSPCIIFIDEIDAVGRQRGAGLGGGNDEREQTLNQLLVEMDGFEQSPVIVIAATNRPDVLDPALLRPGRFDRQVVVPLPDVRGREQILLVHIRKVPIHVDVKASIIARGTPGMSGADLANLVNEAALFAARSGKLLVDMEDFERAKDKILMGAERRSVVMPEEERRNTAYHESGHAVVARVLKKLTDPVHKVTIIPRGRALGVTMQLPEGDRFSDNKARLNATLAVLFGGRIAEELFMNQVTTGASNDFMRATEIARRMVTEWGMGDEADSLGVMVYAENEGEVFLGRNMGRQKQLSEVTMQKVDHAVKRLTDSAYAHAKEILEAHRTQMERMTRALLEWETIDADQIEAIMNGEEPKPPKPVTPPPTVIPPNDGEASTSKGIVPESRGIAGDIGLGEEK